MNVFYVLGDRSSYTVGRDPGGDLVLKDSFVSRRHLKFVAITHDVCTVEVLGGNGAVVKGIKAKRGYKGYLRCGDCVDIGTSRIVWIGGRVRSRPMICPVRRKVPSQPDPVEIENPPPRKVPEKPSVMLAAGPALTMAIPILLGAGRTVAVLSSVFAAMWAVANVTNRVRKQRYEEKRRRNTYLSYLAECEDTIRKRSAGAAKELHETYPAAGRYLKGGANPYLLWNPPGDEEGSVIVRTGTGPVPNSLQIDIPKERFAGVDDSLKEFPGMLRKKYEMLPHAPVLVDLAADTVYGYTVSDEGQRQSLSALIMQLAVSYPPDKLKIVTDMDGPVEKYLMWISILPHFTDEAVGDDEKILRTILITDDCTAAFGSLSERVSVMLIGADKASFPPGTCILNTDVSGRKYDRLVPELCFSYAGSLSRLWGYREKETGIPQTVPFGRIFDEPLIGGTRGEMTEALAARIVKSCEMSDITAGFSAPLGIGEGDERVFLDLHEKASGPHGLIAGTTGSGKSELLTTIILSFSMRYPADKLAFFLVDYKGGGMSNLFDALPHLIGNISNLSKEISRRALVALKSENIKRQEIFSEYGVNNINDYTRLYDLGKAPVPLPHVLIIVDEFAQLRKEEPDFMDALISISQVGRSLGMHLILATQKPAGVIDDKIRGNSRFRMALRLVDRSDSMDMLKRPDATTVKECGRAYLQVGNDEIFTCFQSAYAMGKVDDKKERPRIYEDFLLKKQIDHGSKEPASPSREDDLTWYDLVMDAICLADKRGKGVKPQKLWLPPLPETVEDDEAFAVYDNPYMQRYERVMYEPAAFGHILVIGRSASGKSELLFTLLNRAGEDCALYVIDHGGGRLSQLSELSCCGGFIGDEDADDIARMCAFLAEETALRRTLCEAERRSRKTLIFALDNLSGIRRSAGSEAWENIVRILTFGRSVDVLVAASALASPGTREEKLFDTVLFLGNEDAYAVAATLRVPARDIPAIYDTPGRGVGLYNGAALEFQAVMTKVIPARMAALPPARRYPHVPKEPTLEELLKRAVEEAPYPLIPAGYEIKSGKIYCIPTQSVNTVLICGKAYTGRHTLLFNIGVVSARYGIKCVRADTYEALLAACREAEGLCMVITTDMSEVLRQFYEKSRSSEEEDELISYLENPAALRKKEKAGPVVVAIIENDARTRFSGRRVYDALIRHPYGISFGGSLDENRILDYSYLPYSQMQKSHNRGIATVMKFDEKTFSGDIKVPVRNSVDNSQILINKGLVTHDIDRIDIPAEGKKALYEGG